MLTRAALSFLLLIVGASAAIAQWRDDYPVLRVGMVAGIDPATSRNAAEPFRLYLEDRLETRVELYVANDYAGLISGQLTGRFDLTFLTATAFATAEAACDCVRPIVVPTDLGGSQGFHAILVVASDSPINGPEDLPGMRLAVSTSDSLAGRVLPLALFEADGIDVAAINLVASESPEAAIMRLLEGEADAALAWSTMAGSRSSGYSRGVLRLMVDAGAMTMDAVDIAWSSPLVPYGPVTVLDTLPTDLMADLETAMLDLADADPTALGAVNGVLGGGFVTIDVNAFEPLMVLVRGGEVAP